MTTDVPEGPREGQATGPRFVRLLRLISPTPTVKPRKRRDGRPPAFTPEQERLVRAALKTARPVFGSWKALATAMHFVPYTVAHVACGMLPVSPDLVVRLAKALNVPIDSLVTPGLRIVKHPCPACGGAA